MMLIPCIAEGQILPPVWQWQDPYPTGSALSGVDIGVDGRYVAVGSNGTIIISDDRGVSWKQFTSGSHADWYDVDMATDGMGMIAGHSGRVLVTTDGGDNWTLKQTSTSNFLNTVHIIDRRNAVVVGGTILPTGIAFRTTDGGDSWQQMTLPRTDRTLQDAYFLDTLNGWIVGGSGALFHTVDGGNSWSDGSLNTSSSLNSIEFSDSLRGVIVGGEGTMFVTTDGGASWMPKSTSLSMDLLRIAWKDSLEGEVVGTGHCLTTTDGGSTWIRNKIGKDYAGIATSRQYGGIAVGALGQVSIRDEETGKWALSSRRALPVNLEGVEFIDRKHGAAIGANAYVGLTSDGGLTWKGIWTGFSTNMNDVSLGRDGLIIGVGEEGEVLRSTDSGSTWEKAVTGTRNSLRDIDIADGRHALVVGIGTILTTHDGGATWALDTTTVTQVLHACSMVDSSIGYLAGRWGLVMRTTDGGRNWEIVPTQTSDYITTIEFFSRDSGVFTTRFEVFTTMNGGESWSRIHGPANEQMWGASFLDIERGWVATSTTTVQEEVWKTTDGGETWTNLPHHAVLFYTGAAGMQSLDFVDDTTGWLVGNFGSILRYDPSAEATVDVPVNAEQQEKTLLSLYPNPTRGDIIIRYSHEDRITSVSVTDMKGKAVDIALLLQGIRFPATSFTLSTASLPTGIYYVRVTGEKSEECSMPFIVE